MLKTRIARLAVAISRPIYRWANNHMARVNGQVDWPEWVQANWEGLTSLDGGTGTQKCKFLGREGQLVYLRDRPFNPALSRPLAPVKVEKGPEVTWLQTETGKVFSEYPYPATVVPLTSSPTTISSEASC